MDATAPNHAATAVERVEAVPKRRRGGDIEDEEMSEQSEEEVPNYSRNSKMFINMLVISEQTNKQPSKQANN